MLVAVAKADAVAARRGLQGRLGFVPTLGALHPGHIALLRAARAQCAHVAVSIFVNPTQFDDSEDLAAYPRPIERDLEICAAEAVDLVWTPALEDVYPPGFETHVVPGPLSLPLEGASRPAHFRGVATVVSKLFNVIRPDLAIFGQKDWQQTLVVGSLIRDLDFPVELVIHPTVRDHDGLAWSSRNARLAPDERRAAAVLYKALQAAAQGYERGVKSADQLRAQALSMIRSERLLKPEYVSVADAWTLQELEDAREPMVIGGAVHVGSVRLIDNLVFGVKLYGAGRTS